MMGFNCEFVERKGVCRGGDEVYSGVAEITYIGDYGGKTESCRGCVLGRFGVSFLDVEW